MELRKRAEWTGKTSKYPAAATKHAVDHVIRYSISSKNKQHYKESISILSPIQNPKRKAKVNKPQCQEGERARVMFKMLILLHIFKQLIIRQRYGGPALANDAAGIQKVRRSDLQTLKIMKEKLPLRK